MQRGEDTERGGGARREANRGRGGERGGREAAEGREAVRPKEGCGCERLGDPELGGVRCDRGRGRVLRRRVCDGAEGVVEETE